MKKWLVLSFSILSLALTACSQSGGVPYDKPTDQSQTVVRAWNTSSFPLHISVPDDMANNSNQVAMLNAAAQVWNQALGMIALDLVFDHSPDTQWCTSTTQGSTQTPLNDNYFSLFKQQAWNFSDISSGVLAFTTSLSQGSQMINADILFNFADFDFEDGSNPPLGNTNYIDYQSVVTHELGHFLGQIHVPSNVDSNSVMLANLPRATQRRGLSAGDILRIRQAYNLQ